MLVYQRVSQKTTYEFYVPNPAKPTCGQILRDAAVSISMAYDSFDLIFFGKNPRPNSKGAYLWQPGFAIDTKCLVQLGTLQPRVEVHF